MTDRQQDEKIEEKEEKERSKHEEKTPEEKWRRDPLGSIVWALILIWAGLVFLASNMGWIEGFRLERIPGTDITFAPGGAWPIVFLGAGVIVLGEVIIRLLVPAYRQPVTGSIIFAFILLGIGLGGWTSWDLIWPLVIIAIGLSVIVGAFTRRRS